MDGLRRIDCITRHHSDSHASLQGPQLPLGICELERPACLRRHVKYQKAVSLLIAFSPSVIPSSISLCLACM